MKTAGNEPESMAMKTEGIGNCTLQGSRSGFTLAEVVVAMLLVAMAVAGVYGLATALRNMNHLGNTVSDAASLTQSKIEDLRGQDYASVTSGTDTVNGFTRTWTVTTNATWRGVRVRTEWTDRQGVKTIETSTVLVE